MEEYNLSGIRQSRNRLEYINRNRNAKGFIQLPDNSTIISSNHSKLYCRNYVRFRKSSSRSRSHNNPKVFHLHSSIDHRKKLMLLVLQMIALLHLCSVIYCHKKYSPSSTIKYTITTIVFLNILTYCCVQYDTQQAEYGELLLGESSLLFLIWYGGIIGGGLALCLEKHKHLRSQSFTFRLRILILFNAVWLFIFYVLYIYRNEFLFAEASGAFFSLLEVLQ